MLGVDDQYRCFGLITVKDMEKAASLIPGLQRIAHGPCGVSSATNPVWEGGVTSVPSGARNPRRP